MHRGGDEQKGLRYETIKRDEGVVSKGGGGDARQSGGV